MRRQARFIIIELQYRKQFKIAMELNTSQILSGIDGPVPYSFLNDTYFPKVGSTYKRTNNFATYTEAVEALKELGE